MPNRVIREGILDSERVAALSIPAELFYRKLMSIVDDYGCYECRPKSLWVRLYSERLEQVSSEDVMSYLCECSQGDDPLVVVYELEGKRYLQITGFDQRTRIKNSKYPQPDGHTTAIRLTDDRHVTVTRQSDENPKRIQSESESETNPNEISKTSSSHPKADASGGEDSPKSPSKLEQEFEEDWKKSWRLGGKGAAREKYLKARKLATRETIVEAMQLVVPRAQRLGINPRHVSTWLGQRGWLDEEPPQELLVANAARAAPRISRKQEQDQRFNEMMQREMEGKGLFSA